MTTSGCTNMLTQSDHAAYLWRTVLLQVSASSVPSAARGRTPKSLQPGGQQACTRPNRKSANQQCGKCRIGDWLAMTDDIVCLPRAAQPGRCACSLTDLWWAAELLFCGEQADRNCRVPVHHVRLVNDMLRLVLRYSSTSSSVGRVPYFGLFSQSPKANVILPMATREVLNPEANTFVL